MSEEILTQDTEQKAEKPDTSGKEDVGALRRSKMRVSNERDKAVTRASDLEKKLVEVTAQLDQYKKDQAEQEHASRRKKAIDAKEIDEAWQKKHERDQATFNESLATKDAQIKNLQSVILDQERDKIIDKVAHEIAMSDSVSLVKMVLERHVKVQLDPENKVVPIVHDEHGKETRDSLKDLTRELRKDKRYAKILKGTDAGSGATVSEPSETSPRVAQMTSSANQPLQTMSSEERAKRFFQGNYPTDQLLREITPKVQKRVEERARIGR